MGAPRSGPGQTLVLCGGGEDRESTAAQTSSAILWRKHAIRNPSPTSNSSIVASLFIPSATFAILSTGRSLSIEPLQLGALDMAAKRAPHQPAHSPADYGSPYDDANIPSHAVFDPVPSASGPDFDSSPPLRAMKRRRMSGIAAPDGSVERNARLSASDAASRNVAPFLAKHIPAAYTPQISSSSLPAGMDSKKYCNRHRPDVKCRRQANEPTMEELQNVRNLLPHSLAFSITI
jgi:hypothetical protein